jgi:hypothetical protein
MQSEHLLIDPHGWHASAERALETARGMKPGSERARALKRAGELQVAADLKRALRLERIDTAGHVREAGNK